MADAPYSGDQAAMSRSERGRNPATRLDRRSPAPSFTPLERRGGATAGSQALLYGGSITLLALVAALGFATLRPTPRRRPPDVPVPAWMPAGPDRRV